MKTLRSYPGVLTMLVIALAMSVNAFVDYLNYQVASPSALAAVACLFSASIMVVVYEYKRHRLERKESVSIKS